jgi:tetratricopeptide (TPR) repeat protein
MKRFVFLLLAFALTLVQCKQAEQKVTKEEALKFAADMEQAAMKRKSNLIAANIILPALTSRMSKEKEIKDLDEIEKGMAQGLKNSELNRNVYDILGKNGSFEKVKLYEKDGMQRIIFRAYGDDGLNYLDMELTKLNDKVGIADMMVYSSGENISKSLADLMKKMMDEPNDNKVEDATATFQTIKRLMAKGNYKEAKKEFDQLPYYVKNTRIGDVLNIQISSNLGDEIYMKEIEKFEAKYAGDPNVQLTMIDLYFLRKDYDKALTAINVIDSVINKDSFLDYYRGLVWNVKGNSNKAIEYYKKVTESNPNFPGAYAELMAHYLEKNDKQQAKMYFTKYKNLRDAKDDVINTYETVYPFLKE